MANRYFSVFKISLKSGMAYKAEIVLKIIFSFISSLIILFVWYAAYHYSNTSNINGISLTTTVLYFFVFASIAAIWGGYGVGKLINSDIKTGSIVSNFIRPVNYVYALFVRHLPQTLIFLIFGTIPILTIIYIISGMHMAIAQLIYFIAEIAIAYFIFNLIAFIISIFTIYLSDVEGIMNAVFIIIEILSGAIVPIIFYPKPIYNILLLTPFPFLAYIPISTFLGILKISQIPWILVIGTAWVLVLSVISRILWKKFNRDINIVGI